MEPFDRFRKKIEKVKPGQKWITRIHDNDDFGLGLAGFDLEKFTQKILIEKEWQKKEKLRK
jgi:hypothetical protein